MPDDSGHRNGSRVAGYASLECLYAQAVWAAYNRLLDDGALRNAVGGFSPTNFVHEEVMSELYRTNLHTKKEREIGEYLAKVAQGTYVHFPKTSAVNGLIVGQRVEARRFVEIKTRTCKREEYTTTILNQGKYVDLINLYDRTQVPVSFAVVFTDCICLIAVDGAMEEMESRMAGRTDRPDDGRGQEKCIMIPTDIMKVLPLPEGYNV